MSETPRQEIPRNSYAPAYASSELWDFPWGADDLNRHVLNSEHQPLWRRVNPPGGGRDSNRKEMAPLLCWQTPKGPLTGKGASLGLHAAGLRGQGYQGAELLIQWSKSGF